MSRMSTSCVRFVKKLSVIVFLVPLLLTCASGDELTTGAEFVTAVDMKQESASLLGTNVEETTQVTTSHLSLTNISTRNPLELSNSTDLTQVTLTRNQPANITSIHPPAVSNATHPAAVNNVTHPPTSTDTTYPQTVTDTTRHPVSDTKNPPPNNSSETEFHLSGSTHGTDSPVDTGATHPSGNASITSSPEITSKPVKNETNVKINSSTAEITNTSGNVSTTTTPTPVKSPSSTTNAPVAEVSLKSAKENVNSTTSRNEGTTTSTVNSTGNYIENKFGSEENDTLPTNSTINYSMRVSPVTGSGLLLVLLVRVFS